MPTHYFENMADYASRHGSSGEALFARAKLDMERVTRDGHVRFSEFRALLLATSVETGRTSFALELGSLLTPASHGALGLAVLASDSLRDAFALIVRYVRTRTPLVHVKHHVRDGVVIVRVTDGIVLGDVQRPIHELVIGTLVSALRTLTSGRFRVKSVRFAFAAPDYVDRVARLVGAPALYDARYTELRFDASLLDLDVVLADSTAARLARAKLDAELEALEGRIDLRDRVRERLLRDKGRIPDCEHVARELGTTSRSLRRHLAELDTSFSRIVQETRKDLAVHYLRDTDLGVGEIASLLGYGDPSNFGAAFRTWTGKSPRAYRRRA